jgi:hypothetical protein
MLKKPDTKETGEYAGLFLFWSMIAKSHVTLKERSLRLTLAPHASAGESLYNKEETVRGVYPDRVRDSSLRSE